MAANGSSDSTPSQPLGAPDDDRSGATVDEAIAKAEAGSQVGEAHDPSDPGDTGDSRTEQIAHVGGATEGTVEGTPGETTPPDPGPSPTDIGSGGAQRIVGARISDRVAAGEPVPDGPPFDTGTESDPQDS